MVAELVPVDEVYVKVFLSLMCSELGLHHCNKARFGDVFGVVFCGGKWSLHLICIIFSPLGFMWTNYFVQN